MEVKVYVDVLFIINFIIDYILLSVTSFFAKKTPAVFKMCIASFLGALFAATVFFVPINTFFSFFLSTTVAFLMVFTAFGTKKATILLKDTAIFYLVSITASGIGFAVIFSGKASQMAVNNGIFYADIDAYTLLFIFIISVAIIHTATGYIKKQKIKSSFIYNVTIERNGRTVCDTALFDSANFMRDPISQKSVIIAEWQSVAPLFDETVITEAIVKNPKDFLYIGCRGMGGTTGMYAFCPDNVSSKEIDFSEPVLVAITQTPLDKEGTYRIILPNSVKIES
ncbi:MAG: sigma-E processing peptidase SpoIIGA [Clostridia bacterium]|nr:sigma-E processing peptidase SpoIIGA [Clostridia bacterium]